MSEILIPSFIVARCLRCPLMLMSPCGKGGGIETLIYLLYPGFTDGDPVLARHGATSFLKAIDSYHVVRSIGEAGHEKSKPAVS